MPRGRVRLGGTAADLHLTGEVELIGRQSARKQYLDVELAFCSGSLGLREQCRQVAKHLGELVVERRVEHLKSHQRANRFGVARA